jgi:hypothetical protein
MKWTAKWIWLDYITPWAVTGEFRHERVVGLLPTEKNRFGLFRKTFDLPQNLQGTARAVLSISVDGRYEAYINGEYVGRGIYRCNRHNWYYDELDVVGCLRPGKNVICVVAQFVGESLSWYEPLPHGGIAGRSFGKGGLIFQIDAQADGTSYCITSDQAVRGMPCDAWKQDVPVVHVGLPFVEVFDANTYPRGWLDVEYDDAGQAWGHAMELLTNRILPQLVPCDIPRLAELDLRAERIVSAGMIQPYFDEADIQDSCHDPATDPIDFFVQAGKSTYKDRIEGLDVSWTGGGPVVLDLNGGPAGIVFDMGREVTGFVQFDVVADQGVTIDMVWAEKLDPERDNLMPGVRAFREKTGSQYICDQGENIHQLFHWYGFRYLQANFSGTGQVEVRSFGARLYNYPVEQAGTFTCNDERLNRLYDACGLALRNCMHDGYEDCPSREQRQWVGDAYVEVMASLATFGDSAVPLARKLVIQTAQSQRGDGLTEMCGPGDFDVHGLLIPDYCLYWMQTVHALYWYTGDTALVERLLPSLVKATRWFADLVDPVTGLITDVPNWIFIDWSTNDKWGASCAVNAQTCHAFRLVAELGRAIGWDRAIEELDAIADGIAAGINIYLWDDARGSYIDAVEVGPGGKIVRRSHKVTFHANSLPILYNITPPERVDLVVTNVFDRPYSEMFVQNQHPTWTGITAAHLDEDVQVIVAEPFFFHLVNQALAKVDRQDIIARFLRDGWCRMIDLGATTIWETWGDGGSLCHAWSTTPAYDLATHCLGVRITSPGAADITIEPALFDLSRAEGTVPTVRGPVRVRWAFDESNGRFELDVAAPTDVQVTCTAPAWPGTMWSAPVEETPLEGWSSRVIFTRE